MRHFDDWLRAYCAFTAESESPLPFHFWTGVSTIAGCLRRRVWQDQHYFQWIPNFYIIFVAPPGVVSKSTTINLGMDLLHEVEDIHFGPDSGSWQGLGDALAESTIHFRYINEVGTEELLPMSAVTVAASELGTFLRPDDEGAISFLTDIWDGRKRPYKHKTKHSGGIEIQRPWLNFIGATTPAWLRRNMPESMIGEGLTSRIIFVYADKKRKYVSLPSRVIINSDYLEMRRKLIEDLTHISTLVGPYKFTDEVEREGGWMDVWYEQHNSNRSLSLASDRFGGYLSRKQTHMVKLAMILAASERDDLVINRGDLEKAQAILVEAESSMIRVFESIGVVDEAKHLAELIAFIKAYKWITSDDLYRLCHNIMSRQQYVEALQMGIQGGKFTVEVRESRRGVRLAQQPN